MAKKKTAKKSSAKKSTTKASAAKKVVKKAPAKKSTARAAASKPAAKKATTRKTTARKTTAAAAGKPTPKSSAKKSTSKKSTARKSTARKPTTGKLTAKKSTPAKKAPARTSAAKPARKATTAKAAAKKTTRAPRKTAVASSNGNGQAFDAPPTEEQLRKVKTGLSKRDMEKFRKTLLEKRAELLGDVESLRNDAIDPGAGSLSHVPEHMADRGSDNYEQEFTLGLMESERKLLREIDEALERMEDGIYGVCLHTATPIGKPRLEAKPWARYCIEAARQLERTRRW